MKMKYFRFLYRETNGCFMHFGELSDSDAQEKMTFLYLRGTEELVNQKTEHTLFLCPNHVDLVVLGRSDKATLDVWKRLNGQMEADALVLADDGTWGDVPGAKQVIRLSQGETTYRHQGAGWSFFIKSYEAGSVVVMHGAKEYGAQENSEGGAYAGIEDCVMNVKAVNDHRRCCSQAQPDGFGCALGCVLRQDYDVCKYQDECHEPGELTGTLLLAGTEQRDTMKRVWADAKDCPWSVRFFAVPGKTQKEDLIMKEERSFQLQSAGVEGYRNYYIGMESEMDSGFLDRMCRRGFYHVPVVLGKDQGLCCSGLLKYLEA